MKKLLITLAMAVMLALGAIGFTACNDTKGGSAAQNAEQAYGFSAATAGAIISAASGGTGAIIAQSQGLDVRTATEVTDEAVIEELNAYMLLVESLLADGAFGAKTETSDREEYACKMTVSYKDILGNEFEYTLYYNETLVKEEFDYDDDDGEEETEQTYRLTGVMIIDEAEYAIEGKRDYSVEGDETENEEEFVVYLNETRTMRVEHQIEQEQNEQEQEYTYAIYEGKELIERSSFEYEEDGNETEIELQLTTVTDGVRSTEKFAFERETVNGQERIRIKVGGRDGEAKYTVRVVTDEDGNSQYVYEIAGGGSIVKDRAGER